MEQKIIEENKRVIQKWLELTKEANTLADLHEGKICIQAKHYASLVKTKLYAKAGIETQNANHIPTIHLLRVCYAKGMKNAADGKLRAQIVEDRVDFTDEYDDVQYFVLLEDLIGDMEVLADKEASTYYLRWLTQIDMKKEERLLRIEQLRNELKVLEQL